MPASKTTNIPWTKSWTISLNSLTWRTLKIHILIISSWTKMQFIKIILQWTKTYCRNLWTVTKHWIYIIWNLNIQTPNQLTFMNYLTIFEYLFNISQSSSTKKKKLSIFGFCLQHWSSSADHDEQMMNQWWIEWNCSFEFLYSYFVGQFKPENIENLYRP
jgi:hypothetical protein